MWLITRFGFFSIIQRSKEGTLTVRSRVRDDLVELRDHYFPGQSEVRTLEGTEYPYSITVQRDILAEAMKQVILDINYSNFKEVITDEQGPARANVYDSVWKQLFRLQRQGDGG